MTMITMKQLLEAGMHFGHQMHRWHPKMGKFIFGTRNGIHIIDLQRTVKRLREAYQAVHDVVAQGGIVLFVGTKKQAQQVILEESKRCGMFSVTNRWVGGTLTNFPSVRKNLARLHEYEQMETEGLLGQLPRKEVASLKRKWQKLEEAFSGIQNLNKIPEVVFIVDLKKEYIAVREARRLGVLTVAIVDTNCNPEDVDIAIPGNDDAIRSIKLVTSYMADAVLEGMQEWAAKGGKPELGEAGEMAKASEADITEQVLAAARAYKIESEVEGEEEDLKLFEQAIKGEFRVESVKEGAEGVAAGTLAEGSAPVAATETAPAAGEQPAAPVEAGAPKPEAGKE